MTLELDTRQRAMLHAMGVQVWLPESGVVTLQPAAAPATARPPMPPSAAPVQVPANAPAAQSQPSPAAAPVARPQAQPPATTWPAGVRAEGAAMDWAALTDAVRNCQACALCAGRSNTSLLAPTEQAPCDWMVLGDPPDEEEDRLGASFAGPDGLLLANMLRALGLQRANPAPAANGARAGAEIPTAAAAQRVYVSNVLKCRPGLGALPQPAQLAQCAVHLQSEIALVRPKLILGMGRFANQVLLAESPELAALPLGKLRGTLHSYQGIPVVLTYPPKLLMRNSADKAKAWADLCLAATKLAL